MTAFATLVYGLATVALWHESRQDRIQRENQAQAEIAGRKISELQRAFYDAWGYWLGHSHRSRDSGVDASQSALIFESLIRLECQLRLNGYDKEANNLGIAVRTFHEVEERLAEAAVALGLIPKEYRRVVTTSSTGVGK